MRSSKGHIFIQPFFKAFVSALRGGGGLKSNFSILENFGANFEDQGDFQRRLNCVVNNQDERCYDAQCIVFLVEKYRLIP